MSVSINMKFFRMANVAELGRKTESQTKKNFINLNFLDLLLDIDIKMENIQLSHLLHK